MALHLIRLLVVALVLSPFTSPGVLIDRWLADDLDYLNDGDSVGSWTSLSNRTVAGASGLQPALRKSMTPVGGSAVRFNRHWLTTSSSPFGGATAFSIAVVFKASAPGANDAANWYGKSGIVDAEQGGATADWGTVLDEQGRVAIGTGSPDITTFSTLPSLVDSNYHVAVFTWGGGTQRVYVDSRGVSLASGVSTGPRNGSAGFSFGGIHTAEGGANRRFVGDLVEVRFYNTALSGAEATNVITELSDTHINLNIPRIYSFTANTNQIYLGQSATLSWNVTNATSIVIDNSIGPVAMPSGNISVSPTNTTTYTLTATNSLGRRTSTTTIIVDPGVPVAFNLSTNTPRNTPVSFSVSADDPNGGTLSYLLVTPPAHGTLSGTLPSVIYSPEAGFDGTDVFTFKVNDSTFDSAPATVSIKVVPPPTPPTGIVLSTTNISASAHPGSFIAALRTIDPNEFDTHAYALVAGFGDNSRFTIAGNQLMAGPSFATGPGVTFSIRLRTTDNAGFSYEQTFALRVVTITDTVVINEVHYNPPLNPVREEFVELYNNTDAPIDLSGWRLRGGVDFFISPGTVISARGFVVIAESPATIQSRYGVAALGPWSGNLSGDGEQLRLDDSNGDAVDEVDYRSEFPWPIRANGDGPSMQLVNPNLDNDLGSSWRSGTPVTPGATNSVFAANAAPNIRQVNHSPKTPASTNNVLVTAKITDPEGVASVQLLMQIVRPGSFIPSALPLNRAQLDSLTTNPFVTNSLNPAFEAATNWTTIAMNDDGLNGDAVAGDDIYSAVLPQQANRTLVRYRITATDTLGASRRAPFEDDPSLNFAHFVYDGIPSYQNYSPAVLQTLPVYTLITRAADVDQCAAWFNTGDQLPQSIGSLRNEGRLSFNWEGAMVYDGEVYDHITYRLRGANGRYHNGKRSFRFRFRSGHLLEAKNQEGDRFPTKWRELTTGKGQSNRGSETFALNEVINYFLWNKVGVPAPSTFHFHFRVIRGAQESPTDRYAGDFWGLSWAQEKYDVNFLDAHGLPKGNLYKLVDNFVLGLDEMRYQAPLAVTNAADFFNIENNLTGFQTADWLNAHANYTNWYRYFTVAEAIRHYDIWPSANKNGAWYFEPIYSLANSNYGRMMQLPYDSTDTWGPTWNNGEDILFNGIFASSATGGDSGQNPEMQKEYRNVAREIRDLLFQPDQINPLIDAFVARLRDFAPADHLRWSNAPSPASYVSLGIPGSPGVTSGLLGTAQDLKNFMFAGGNYAWWIDRTSISAGGWITRLDTVAADAAVPSRPIVTYAGSNGIPINNLVFRSSVFADPQGADTIASMQWRVAEIT
ncbi:MAG TPA: lamin tail domain-containing protein, partial [Candidatus Binatia bacterium]|nr:lamin tail domain-containing protein [Candidatus Binatia bacterium]